MTIRTKNGAPVLGTNGTLIAKKNSSAPNYFDWQDSTVVLEKDSDFGPFRLVVDIDSGVTPPDSAFLVLFANQNGEDVHITIPFPNAPVVGEQTIAGTWSIANLPGAYARLYAASSAKEIGVAVPEYTTDINTPTDPTPDDVELLSSPSLSPSTQDELGPVGLTVGTYSGSPGTITYLWEDSLDGSTGWTQITGSGTGVLTVWPAGTRAFARVTEIVTGQGIATTLETTTSAIGITPTVDLPLSAPEYEMESTIAYTGATTWVRPKLDFTNKPPGQYGVDWWFNWSTDTQFPPRAQNTESGVAASVEVPPGVYEIHMDVPADDGNPVGVSPRVNFSVFQSSVLGVITETARASSFQVQYQTPTQIGEWAAKRTVPDAAQVEQPLTPYTTGNWVRLVERYRGQYEAKEFGGQGSQFLRGFALHEDETIVACMDQNLPWISHNFGGTWDTPKCVGAGSVMTSGCAAWIDPDNSDHWIVQYSEGSAGTALNHDAALYDGLFRTLDGGDTLLNVVHFAQHGTQIDRGDKQYGRLAHDPTTSGSSRHIYCLQTWGTTSTTLNTIQFWRSTDNGATWAKRGTNLPAATYGTNELGPNWIGFSDDGQLYMCGPKGAFKSSDKGATAGNWTSLHGSGKLPTGQDVRWMQVYGSGSSVTIWACPRGGSGGLYKSTDNGANFTKNSALGTVNIDNFAVHPANRNYIYVVINGVGAKNSNNGGSTWFSITSTQVQGQEQGFESRLWGQSTSVWPHPTDSQQTYWHRFQHLGSSETSHKAGTGANAMVVHFNGNNYNGIHYRGMAFHPSDWRKYFAAPQDKVGFYTEYAGLYWINDCFTRTNEVGVQVAAITGTTPSTQGMGAFITSTGRLFQTARMTASGGGGATYMIVNDPQNGDSNLPARLSSNAIRVVDDEIGDIRWYASVDPNNSNTGYFGARRLNTINAASTTGVTSSALTNGRFFGVSDVSGSTVVWGFSGNNGLRRLTSGTAFSNYYTTLSSYQRYGSVPVLAHDPTANRVYCASGAGRLIRVEGTSPAASSERVIFDPKLVGRNEYMSLEVTAGRPSFQIGNIIVDPNDPETVYVAMYMWGVSKGMFMTRNAISGSGWVNGAGPGANPVVWTDITEGVATTEVTLFVHPLTSDLFYTTSHGVWVRQAPQDTRNALSVSTYAFTRLNTGNGTATSISGAKDGSYAATCTTAGGTGVGKFNVTDSDGISIGLATVGTAFAHAKVNFTLNDGSVDFIVGDRFVFATSIHDVHRDFIRGIV
jgi:hypothetical protein